jgi:DNA gyrase subunit A
VPTDSNLPPETPEPPPPEDTPASVPSSTRSGGLPSKRLIDVSIEDELKSSYLTYSMSVIVSRALPD